VHARGVRRRSGAVTTGEVERARYTAHLGRAPARPIRSSLWPCHAPFAEAVAPQAVRSAAMPSPWPAFVAPHRQSRAGARRELDLPV